MIFSTEQTILVANHLELAISIKISKDKITNLKFYFQIIKWNISLIIARVQGISAAFLGAKLERKECILAPRYIGIHMYLVLRFR